MSDVVDGPVAPERQSISRERAAKKVRGFARHLGADLVGIGPLDPVNVYTHVGKTWGDPTRTWGQPIEVTHRNAVSLAVGLNPAMLSAGPVLPEVVQNSATPMSRGWLNAMGRSVVTVASLSALPSSFVIMRPCRPSPPMPASMATGTVSTW